MNGLLQGQVKRAVLLLTHRCNLACRHCAFSNGTHSEEDESFSHWKAAINSLARCGLEHVVLSGGEPTLRHDFVSLLEYAARRAQRVIVCTNSTHLSQIPRDIADPARIKWIVSLHGAEATDHDAIVGSKGAFRLAMRGVATLRARTPKAQICVNTVIDKPAFDLRPLIRTVSGLGAQQLCIIPHWEPGKGDARTAVAGRAERDLAASLGVDLIDLRARCPRNVPNFCAAISGVVIDARGNAYPCMPAAGGFRPDARLAIGNVFLERPEAFLASPRVVRFRRRAWYLGTRFCHSCPSSLRIDAGSITWLH